MGGDLGFTVTGCHCDGITSKAVQLTDANVKVSKRAFFNSRRRRTR
jgi:hypothetical protein